MPWPRLARVAWRQHRLVLAGIAVLLAGACLVMLINGLIMRASLRSLGLTACHPMSAPGCEVRLQLFAHEYHAWASELPAVFLVLPMLIGVFAGGPLLARELETGTFRFAWTQGAGRLRWLTARLALLAVSLTAGAALFSLMFSWWYQPFFALGDSLLAQDVFLLSGAAFAAWTLAAFAISAFAGVVIRRTIPAMAAALGASAALYAATTVYLRQRYQAAVAGHGMIPGRSWILSGWYTCPDGKRVSDGTMAKLLTSRFPPGRAAPRSTVLRWLGQRGYHLWTSYQPESRFWHFQLIEAGWLLALAVLLGAATIWLVRRAA